MSRRKEACPLGWFKSMFCQLSIGGLPRLIRYRPTYSFWQTMTLLIPVKKQAVIGNTWYWGLQNLPIRAGSASFTVGCLVNTQRKVIGTELTVWNRDFYDYLSAHKQDFEREIGHELIWHGEGKHTLRIYVETPGNIKGTEKGWNEFFSWYCEMAPKFLISARKYLETFNQNNRKRWFWSKTLSWNAVNAMRFLNTTVHLRAVDQRFSVL